MASDDIEITFMDLSKFRKKSDAPPYPLTGIVGQHAMKRALFLAASSRSVGNIIFIGEAGTGKVTSAKGLKDILPETEMVNGCDLNCDPRNAPGLCQNCRASSGDLIRSVRRLPLLELPIGASKRRIFGGLDRQSRLKPGFVGQANRGYLIIARANVLEPEHLDRILDISESGIHESDEKSGAFTHPASFNVIATMNPEDGELEQDTLERFSMAVKVQSIRDIEERIEIVRRVESYRKDPDDFVKRNRREMEAFALRVKRARDLVNRVDMPKKAENAINKVLERVGQDNDRARNALTRAAMANAAFGDRVWATVDDVAEIAELVLGHRKE